MLNWQQQCPLYGYIKTVSVLEINIIEQQHTHIHTHTRVLILTATSQWRHLSCITFPVMGSIAPWCIAKEQHCLTAEKSANNVNSHPKQQTIQTRILEPSPGLKS